MAYLNEINKELAQLGATVRQTDAYQLFEVVSAQAAKIEADISKLKDSKLRGVYRSVKEMWLLIGELRAQLSNLEEMQKHQFDDVRKALGQSNRLYAWMMHMEKVDARFKLPDREQPAWYGPRKAPWGK